MMIWPLFRYVLTAALRDKFLLSIAGILAVVASLSFFFGATAITEQSDFAKTFIAFGLRLFGVVALSLFVVSYIRRSFENRDIEYLLSRPVGRVGFVLSHATAFFALGTLTALIMVITVGAVGREFTQGLLLWGAGLVLEFVIMANLAMFFSLVMVSHTACLLGVFGFYLLSRLMGEILGILNHGGESGPVMIVFGKIMEIISILVPRFDVLGRTEWVLYGTSLNNDLMFIFLHSFVLLGMIISAAAVDLHRRQF